MPRPAKYVTFAERQEARKLQTRLAVRAHRQRKKDEAALATQTRKNSSSSASGTEEDDSPTQEPVTPLDYVKLPPIRSYFEGDEKPPTEIQDYISTVYQVPVRRHDIVVDKEKVYTSDIDDSVSEWSFPSSRPRDRQDSSSSAVTQSSLASFSPASSRSLTPLKSPALGLLALRRSPSLPPELPINNTPITHSLVDDFLRMSGCDMSWFPYAGAFTWKDTSGDVAKKAAYAAHGYFVALRKRDEGLQYGSRLAYHEAVKDLRNQVAKRTDAESPIAVLMAQCMLMWFEVLEDVKARYLQRDWKPDCYPGQHLGWAKHLTAAKLLLSKAGPQHFSKGMGVQLLLGTIPRLIWGCFRERRKCFLASENWLHLLRTLKKPQVKDSIWHIAVQIPGLMQRLDNIPTEPDKELDDELRLWQLDSLHEDIRRLDQALNIWMSDFESARSYLHSYRLWWSSTSLYQTTADIFSPPLDFATLAVAEAMMIFWTYKLQLAALVHDIERRRLPKDSAELEDAEVNPRSFAYLICRAGVYWSRWFAWCDVLFTCFSFPLRIAANWFASCGDKYAEEVRCCRELAKHMQWNNQYGLTAEYVLDAAYGHLP